MNIDDSQPTQSLRELFNSLTHTFFKTIKDLGCLARAEARLAGKSLIHILLLTIVIRILAIITWISLCGALGFYLFYLLNNWALSFLIIAIVNGVLLGLTAWTILQKKKNLLFSATRRQLQQMTSPIQHHLDEDTFNEQTKIGNKTVGTASNDG